MFDIGWTEMLVIAIVMIVVVGPKDLPRMLRTFGKTTTKLRSMAGDFQRQFNEALKEAELDDVKKSVDELRGLNPASQVRKQLNPFEKAAADVRAGLDQALKPSKPPEPAPATAHPAEPLKNGPTTTADTPGLEPPSTPPLMTPLNGTPASPPVTAAPAEAPVSTATASAAPASASEGNALIGVPPATAPVAPKPKARSAAKRTPAAASANGKAPARKAAARPKAVAAKADPIATSAEPKRAPRKPKAAGSEPKADTE